MFLLTKKKKKVVLTLTLTRLKVEKNLVLYKSNDILPHFYPPFHLFMKPRISNLLSIYASVKFSGSEG